MNPREFCRQPEFQSAVLLTYSFDPLFFERIVLPDLWASGVGDVLVVVDAGELAEHAPRWRGQLRHLGKRYQVVPAAVAGTFHPKVFLKIGKESAGVWIGSGNVTAGDWGGNRELADPSLRGRILLQPSLVRRE